MTARIVLFGATGFTGTLVADALATRGLAPLLVARDGARVAALAGRLGGLEHAVADATDAGALRALLRRGDVLVSTVGPFTRVGETAVRAAIDQGAHHLDCAGEAPFIRDVFAVHGPRAAEAGCGLVTAFGFDFVAGNLAGALALRGAGGRAARIDVGYFVTGSAGWRAASSGTRASAAGLLVERAHAWRDGRIVLEPPGRTRRSFTVDGRRRRAICIGGTEPLALPRLGRVDQVSTFLGTGAPALAVARGAGLLARVPGTQAVLAAASGRLPGKGGAGAQARARTGGVVVALAADAAGRTVAEARVRTGNPYELTAALLAWGAEVAATGGLRATGALGPVDAFGLEALRKGAQEAGARVG